MIADPTTDTVAAPAGLAPVLDRLDDEQRTYLENELRQKRLPLLAGFLRQKEDDVVKEIGERCGLPVIEDFELMPKATELVPTRLIYEFQCVPFVRPEDPGGLNMVTLWPPEPNMDEWIYAVSGRHPRWFLAPSKAIVNCITQNFGVGGGELDEDDYDEAAGGREVEVEEDEDAAIIRFVNEVIQKAVEDRATDIHFEPLKESLQIRYRIDGELVPIRVPDNLINYQGAIIARLKIMAKLNISEKRRPQDGRINYHSATSDLDVRISTMPTMYGESVSLRLLNQKNQPLGLSELGMLQEDQDRVKSVLDLPHGIILVTGPTGSGKSTSLTAFIRHINTPGRRIITVEDPVEYEVPGVNQTQVHHEIGFDFASALRHILRQDPDVIMVGEIRDRETSDIAVRASLTGHLVFSTLHTNDAPGALTRLTDMDIEPFLIASAVELIIAQRLVRRLCPHCRRPSSEDQHYLEACLTALRVPRTPENLSTVHYEPVGCERCRKYGFRGRIGLFEIVRVDESLHDLIIERASAAHIRQVAMQHDMVTLQESGWKHVSLGNTSFPEVLRYAKHGEEEEVELVAD